MRRRIEGRFLSPVVSTSKENCAAGDGVAVDSSTDGHSYRLAEERTNAMRGGGMAWRMLKSAGSLLTSFVVVTSALDYLRSYLWRNHNNDTTILPWARPRHLYSPPAGVSLSEAFPLYPSTAEAFVDASRGFYERRAIAGRFPEVPPSGEPAGIVFDAGDASASPRLPAAALLAAAGSPVRLIENDEELKETIQRCRVADGCAEGVLSTRLRLETARLIADRAISRPKKQVPPLFVAPEEAGAWGNATSPIPGGFEEAFTTREGRPGSPARASAPRQETRERPGGLATRVFDEGLPGEERGEDGAEEAQRGEGEVEISAGKDDDEWSVLMLGGWLADDMEVMLRAFPNTPWLYLYPDGSSSPCDQMSSAKTALRLMSTPLGISKGVVLASSQFGPVAAARLLTRHFGGRLRPIGELSMSEVYARHGATEDTDSRYDSVNNSSECSADSVAGNIDEECGNGHQSFGGRQTMLRLREVSSESAKVLGGPFDTDWWSFATAKEGDRNTGRERRFHETETVDKDSNDGGHKFGGGTSYGSCPDGGEAQGSLESSALRFEGYIEADDDERGSAGGRGRDESRPSGEWREGRRREKEEQYEEEAGVAKIQEMIGGLPRRGYDRGLQRMVDGHAPLWMSSEAYSEPMAGLRCPDRPTPGYPVEWPLLDLLRNWNPGNASEIPARHFLGVCRFDYRTELNKAQAYAFGEVPFIVYNVPELDEAVQEWSDPISLSAALGDELHSIDISSSNRFLYYGKKRVDRPPGWTPPTRRTLGTFYSWLIDALREPAEAIHANGKDRDSDQCICEEERRFEEISHSSSDFKNLTVRVDEGDGACRGYSDADSNVDADSRARRSSSSDIDLQSRESRDDGSEAVRSRAAQEESQGEREGNSVDGSRGAGEYYYMKLSSTVEHPHPFVERSLPFFNPAVSLLDDEDSFFPDSLYADDVAGSGDAIPEMAIRNKGHHGISRRISDWWNEIRATPTPFGYDDRDGEIDDGGAGSGINIFLRDASATKGIHCRLGMDGVMSEGHYDGSRNMVALLAGKRRWILSRPHNCDHMHMFRRDHPSARHTSADWTDPDVVSRFPRLAEATANEVILRAGEMLYVPENWIHAVINIGVSAQCNSRSGRSFTYKEIIEECEFNADSE